MTIKAICSINLQTTYYATPNYNKTGCAVLCCAAAASHQQLQQDNSSFNYCSSFKIGRKK